MYIDGNIILKKKKKKDNVQQNLIAKAGIDKQLLFYFRKLGTHFKSCTNAKLCFFVTYASTKKGAFIEQGAL